MGTTVGKVIFEPSQTPSAPFLAPGWFGLCAPLSQVLAPCYRGLCDLVHNFEARKPQKLGLSHMLVNAFGDFSRGSIGRQGRKKG